MANDTTSPAYQSLVTEMREISILSSCQSVLHWDEETYMPVDGRAHRAEQKSAMAGLLHKRFASKQVGDLLAAAEECGIAKDDPIAAANLREWRRGYDRAVKLPLDLVQAFSKATSASRTAWQDARRDNTFKTFLAPMKETLRLVLERADAYGHDGERYDSMIETFEPYTKTADIEGLFSELRPALADLVQQITAAPKQPDASILQRTYPVEQQQTFVRDAVEQIGFTWNAGRLDETTHPFCTRIGPGDVRILTRFEEKYFNMAFFGSMHEAGHGLYERNLRADCYGQPMGSAVSLGVHESQSRTWENIVARSHAYWEFQFPNLQSKFPDALNGVTTEDFVFAINHVKPSLIRVEADEVTYNLHILIRFELELAMVRGELALEDLPDAWNSKYRDLLGVEVPTDTEGCLQDVHWGSGMIGYFPTYTLGNLYAAQFFKTAQEQLGDQYSQFRQGKFDTFRHWLQENIHVHGSQHKAIDLVEKVTGKAPDVQDLLQYLRERFLTLYGLG